MTLTTTQNNSITLQHILRYQPGFNRRMTELLTATASHLPRIIAHRVVEAPTSGPLALPLEGTVVFADIDGFTPLAEKFSETASREGAEVLTDLVNRFLEILITTTLPYGGDIQKFGGDAGMLLFTGEDHALRAVTASLEVQETMIAQMSEVETPLGRYPLHIAIGMGSGRMVGVGLGNRNGREWLITGDPLAAMGRAQGVAPPGGVVIDAETYRRCGDALDCSPLSSSLSESDPLSNGLPESGIEDALYLVNSVTAPPDARPLPALPVPPQVQDVEHLDWLLSRMDALTPYLAPGLLEQLTTAANPTQIQPWSEHRYVTILMLSLANLPDVSVHWDDPDALRQAVHVPNDIFTAARDIVYRYDGIVNKIGASPQGAYMMVLFGAPTAHEDDPLRAVLAALELHAQWPETQLRIGINSGFVFAGDVGTAERREYTVMGDTVNFAYRLMSGCRPGETWLGPDTAQHHTITRRIEGVTDQPQKFKGKRHAIAPFIARGVRQMLSDTGSVELPLVGRDTELAQFKTILDQLEAGQSQHVTLHGVAGIGKSRLVHTLTEVAREAGLNVYSGRAPSYGAHLPYAAWETPLRALLDLDGVPLHRMAALLQLALDDHNLSEWAALIAPLVGVEIEASPEIAALTPEMREQQRQSVVRTLLQNAAADRPCLLVLENAQWMPEAALTLLDAVMTQIDAPVLVLVTYRNDDALAARWQSLAQRHDIILTPLPRRATLALARAVVRTRRLPRDVERWITKTSAGVPLFIIEAVRTLVVAGVLERHDDAWTLTQPLDDAPLPETAFGLLQSRIDQLDPPSRHLLRAATAVGEQMTIVMLITGYGEEPRPVIERRLPRLHPLGLVPGDSQGDILVFRQPLIREVAYRGLPFRIRRAIHRRLADYLNTNREQATSNWLALLAYHAFEGQSWALAAQANLDLGRRALDSYLTDQAIQALEHALAAIEAGQLVIPETHFETLHLLGETLAIFGKYDQALERLNQARAILPATPTSDEDSKRLAHIEFHIASIFETLGRYEEAFEAIERGLGQPGVDAQLEGAQLYLAGSGLHHRQGHASLAQSWGERSVALAEKSTGAEARKTQAQGLYLLAFLASMQGEPEKALALGQQSLDIYQKLRDLMGEVNARTNLLLINLTLGDWDKAVEHGELGLKLAQRIHHTEGEARIAANLGEVYRCQGRIAQARTSYEHTLGIAQASGLTYGVALMENNLATLALMEDNLDEADERLDKAAALIEQLGAKTLLPELYRHRGALALAQNDPVAAHEWAERARQEAVAQNDRQEASHAHRLLTEVYLRQGQCEAAATTLEQALTTTHANRDRYGELRTRILRAQWQNQCDAQETALATLQSAIQALTGLGALHDVQKAQSLLQKWQKTQRSP